MSRAGLAVAANLLDPPPPDDPWPILGYNPSPKQRKFHEATEWDVLYGGAMGGGKTVALLMEGIRACVYHPGIEVWVFRRTTVQLRGSIIKELARFGYAKKIGCRWKDQERQLHFPKHGGSVLKFVYADNEKDATDYYSWECNMLIIDERQLMPPSIVEHLSLRIRSGHNDPVLGIRSGANPGGIGHGYLRSGWVRPATTDTKGNPLNIIDPLNEPGEDTDVRITPVHPNGKLGRPRRFILAKWYDNPHLNDDYEQNFEDIPDPVLREAMRDGNWDLFADMAFPEWRPEVYVVDPEEYPISLGGVVRAVGIDWGIAAPFCALWGAKTGQDDTIIVYRELYKAGLTTEEQAQEILSVESDEERVSGRRATYYVDPSMGKAGSWTTGEKAAWYAPKSDAWIYAHNGIPVARAVNDRVLGKRQIHEQLRCVGPPEDRRPKLLIYSNCTNLIRTLPELMRSQRNPEDVEDKGAEDHAYDALRYLVCGLMLRTPTVTKRGPGAPRTTTAAASRAAF